MLIVLKSIFTTGIYRIFRVPVHLWSSWCYRYMYLIYFVTFFTLPLSELILVGLVLDRHVSVSFRAEESQLCLRFFVIISISGG